jgi:pantothenate kinase
MYFLFQKVLQDKEQELIEQFDSPDKIRQILSAFSNIIAKSKETVE